MKYTITYTNRAVKDISQLDGRTKARIKETLEKYSESPLKYARKMVDVTLGTYRFRVGDNETKQYTESRIIFKPKID